MLLYRVLCTVYCVQVAHLLLMLLFQWISHTMLNEWIIFNEIHIFTYAQRPTIDIMYACNRFRPSSDEFQFTIPFFVFCSYSFPTLHLFTFTNWIFSFFASHTITSACCSQVRMKYTQCRKLFSTSFFKHLNQSQWTDFGRRRSNNLKIFSLELFSVGIKLKS